MIRQVILKLHKLSYGANNKNHYKGKNFFLYVICNITSRFCDLAMNALLWAYGKLGLYPKPLCERNGIVVSLTSFPKRINKVWMVIDSMMHQQMRPEKICLYLTEEEFPHGRESLPKRLLAYEKLGLEICFRKYNLMPHNKYFYALQEYPDKYVVTVDDDMYYHNDLISNLWSTHTKYPDAVSSNSICIIQTDSKDAFMHYDQWDFSVVPQKPSLRNVALGYNGVLYPTALFKEAKDMFDTEKIKTMSLKADDLWLRASEIVYGIKVASGEHYCSGTRILGAQAISLQSFNNANIEANGNNIQWKKLCEYFKIAPERLK